MPKQYRSPLMASVHETAKDLYAAGVMDEQTLREFDRACLVHPSASCDDRSTGVFPAAERGQIRAEDTTS